MDRLIAGRYELLDRLGTGGAATVYRARDVRLDRVVAVKILHEQLATDADFQARFEREARAAASLNHPNVVDVYDYGADGATAYIVMPFVAGGNLKERIQARGRLPPTEARDLARQVLAALTAAHSLGLVHRDVKPQNVLLTADNVAKLTDFGIAHVAAQAELTQIGTTIGTAAYIAPEQATGAPVGPPADVYGVGLLLYEMLVGRPPFVGGTPMEVAYRQVNEQPAPPRELVPSIPSELEAVVLRALRKDPAARYSTAEAMLAALDAPFHPSAADRTSPMATVRMPAAPAPASGLYAAPVPPPRHAGTGLIVTTAILGLLAALGMGGALAASRYGLLGGARPTTATAAVTASAAQAAAAVPTRPLAISTATTAAPPASPTTAAPPASPTTTAPPPSPTPASASATPTRPPPTSTATAVPPSPSAQPSPTPTGLLRVMQTPTLPPPVPVATAKPAAKPAREGSVGIPDTAFQGGYRNPNGSVYRGQPSTWVYGQRTPYSTMSATFEVPFDAQDGLLRIVGLDSEDAKKTAIEILVNDQSVARGPSPFPNDVPGQPQGPWAELVIELRRGVLHAGRNTLTIRNLEDSANIGVPFVAIHKATVVYRG